MRCCHVSVGGCCSGNIVEFSIPMQWPALSPAWQAISRSIVMFFYSQQCDLLSPFYLVVFLAITTFPYVVMGFVHILSFS